MNGWHQMNPKHKSRDTKIDKRRYIKVKMICKGMKRLMCWANGHPKELAPVIELWEASQGTITIFKCERCDSKLGSIWHD